MASKFAWLDGEVDPILAECRRVAREVLMQVSDLRETADELAGAPGVPLEPLVGSLRGIRDAALALERLSREVEDARGKVEEMRDNMDFRFDDILEQLRKVATEEVVAERGEPLGRLVAALRARRDRRLHLARLKEEKGGEERYVQVSRLFAAEIDDILCEAGVPT